jgi:hypothetical protein
MIDLKLQDEANGSFKVFDLRQAIGREFSDNHSPTLRSKLLEVSKCGNICTVISVDSHNLIGGKISKQPSYLTWNALFY